MPADSFTITVEVVPPAGSASEPILSALGSLTRLAFDGFSVATNPVAKPRMSAMALCMLIQQKTGKPAILHCTTRDHNRISLQGLLWGAVALGIEAVLAATGDFVALGDRATTTDVRDIDVFELVGMSRAAGMRTGVVLDPRPESGGLMREVRRLERKIEAGAQFVVTQPVYDEASADELAEALRRVTIPVVMGVLPLRTAKHAEFLHRKVAGIAVPERVRQRMHDAANPVAAGAANAIDMLTAARQRFSGVCIMPPFDHYEMLFDILEEDR
ncbi:MAG: homocysteine methyltransferase [Deltaproteobacteria bacterium SG8_13]|nr:MAG: homocysteine methyltransferase [Deltaproteobacteria bacterium SG8_13]